MKKLVLFLSLTLLIPLLIGCPQDGVKRAREREMAARMQAEMAMKKALAAEAEARKQAAAATAKAQDELRKTRLELDQARAEIQRLEKLLANKNKDK